MKECYPTQEHNNTLFQRLACTHRTPHSHASLKGSGLNEWPWCSYPALPPSAAGSSPSGHAHPVVSAPHLQHCGSQNSCLERSRADPPAPRGKKKIITLREHLARRFYINWAALHLAIPVLLSHLRHSPTKRFPVLSNATEQEEAPGSQDLMVPQHHTHPISPAQAGLPYDQALLTRMTEETL